MYRQDTQGGRGRGTELPCPPSVGRSPSQHLGVFMPPGTFCHIKLQLSDLGQFLDLLPHITQVQSGDNCSDPKELL